MVRDFLVNLPSHVRARLDLSRALGTQRPIEVEMLRGYAVADACIRSVLPILLDAMPKRAGYDRPGRQGEAKKLRDLAPIESIETASIADQWMRANMQYMWQRMGGQYLWMCLASQSAHYTAYCAVRLRSDPEDVGHLGLHAARCLETAYRIRHRPILDAAETMYLEMVLR